VAIANALQLLLLLGSQNGLNAPDSTVDHNFKLWYIHTTIFSGKSYSGNIALNSYFSDFVVLY